jgi:hypothetical protein
MKTNEPPKLTYKQRAFINEYLLDFNATQAAIRAGYSEKTAYSIGSENLRKPEIFDEIQRRLNERALTAEEALDIISQQGKADMGDYLETTRLGFSLNLSNIKERGLSRPIKKIKQRTTTFISKKEDDEDREVHEIEIELYDAQAASDKILRVHGRYKNPENDLGQITLKIVREGEHGTDSNPA